MHGVRQHEQKIVQCCFFNFIGSKCTNADLEKKMKEGFLICFLEDCLKALNQGLDIIKCNFKWELKKIQRNDFFQSEESAANRSFLTISHCLNHSSKMSDKCKKSSTDMMLTWRNSSRSCSLFNSPQRCATT